MGKEWNRGNAGHGGSIIGPPRHSAQLTDKFEFMAPHLQPNLASDADLSRLGDATQEEDEAKDDDPVNNRRIPSGYTYFGQFIDHDLTFDPLSVLGGPNRLNDFLNFRTPRFDLDSLYGHGPHDQPYMYDGPLFRLGKKTADQFDDLLRVDVPSNPGDKLAVIGDKRNDENLIVSQIHLFFIKYHNAVIAELKEKYPDHLADKVFDIANQIVRWRYQHIVLFDYLRRITLPAVFTRVREHGPKCFHTPKGTFMPLEFSVAAFRMGHSMVRFNYALNKNVRDDSENGLSELRVFTDNPDTDLRGFRPRPEARTIRWKRFFEFGEDDPDDPTAITQFSMAIDSGLSGMKSADPKKATGLADLPHDVPEDGKEPFVLAERNLLRGRHLGRGLPSGQTLARHFDFDDADILSGDRLKVTTTVIDKPTANENDNRFRREIDQDLTAIFKNDTPLWYYILKEAEVLGFHADANTPLGAEADNIPLNEAGTNGGRTLGPLGSLIVAEVFFRLMLDDPESILGHGPTVVPPEVAGKVPRAGQFGAPADGVFTLADLVTYAHELKLTPIRPGDFGKA